MDQDVTAVSSMHPIVEERRVGGWLAVSPVAAPIQIGVEGTTREDAVTKFVQKAGRWAELVEEGRVRV